GHCESLPRNTKLSCWWQPSELDSGLSLLVYGNASADILKTEQPFSSAHCFFQSPSLQSTMMQILHRTYGFRIMILSSLVFTYKNEVLELLLRKIPKRLLSLSKAIFSWALVSEPALTRPELFEALALKDNARIPPIDFNNRQILQSCDDKFR